MTAIATPDEPRSFRDRYEKASIALDRFEERFMLSKTLKNLRIVGGEVTNLYTLDKVRAKDCTVEIFDGSNGTRSTATRVAAGAVLWGGAGALIGAIAKKRTGTIWVVLNTPKGAWEVKVKPSNNKKAQEFVKNLYIAQTL